MLFFYFLVLLFIFKKEINIYIKLLRKYINIYFLNKNKIIYILI